MNTPTCHQNKSAADEPPSAPNPSEPHPTLDDSPMPAPSGSGEVGCRATTRLPPGVKGDHDVPLGLGRGGVVRDGADVVAAALVLRGAGLVLLEASMIVS